MKLFKKLFIKNYTQTDKPEVRFAYGKTAGIFGIITNSILFSLKILVGIIGNSITIIADAINNLSDAGSSVVTLLGFKLASRPADKEHPYGHARYEFITGLIVALFVLVIGVLLGKASIEKIITPEDVSVSFITYIILCAAILIKLIQMLLYFDFGKSINSPSLKASAIDSRNDVISTTAVLIATIVIHLTNVNIDGYMGLAVSLFIIISSIKLIKETIEPLLGTAPDKEFVETVKNKILSYNEVLGIHDLMVHNYGAAHSFIMVHVEVDAHSDIQKSHDLMDTIERDFKNQMGIVLSIHMDPIVTDDEQTNEIKEKIITALEGLNSSLKIHDFRVVFGSTHNNIIFDVVIPYELNISKEEIIAACNTATENSVVPCYFVIDIDRNYI